MSASKMMSASRISPVSGFARDGPMAKADAVIRQAGLIAAVRQLGEAIVNDDGVAAAINRAIVRSKKTAAGAGVGRFDLQLDVPRECLHLVPRAAVGIEHAKPQLAEIGHE